MESRIINIDDCLQEVLTELQEAEQALRAAELRAASLRGQRALLLRMMQPKPEPPTPGIEEPRHDP
jgi:hypothetical protein